MGGLKSSIKVAMYEQTHEETTISKHRTMNPLLCAQLCAQPSLHVVFC